MEIANDRRLRESTAMLLECAKVKLIDAGAHAKPLRTHLTRSFKAAVPHIESRCSKVSWKKKTPSRNKKSNFCIMREKRHCCCCVPLPDGVMLVGIYGTAFHTGLLVIQVRLYFDH